jgi:hypothetical protein
MSFTKLLVLFFAAISLRLQGPSSENGIGRVEVFYKGQWGTICDDNWGINDAAVVCRQLGYLNALEALQGGSVPDGSGKIWLDEVQCKGTEQNLSSCAYTDWGNNDCSHGEDAGVKCSSTGKFTNNCIYSAHPNFISICSHAHRSRCRQDDLQEKYKI